MSWRINTIFQDKSQTVQVYSGAVGGVAIKASRGPEAPLFIDKGQTQRILDIFGYPSPAYPGVQDVIDFNKTAGLWVSAPSTAGVHGGAMITKNGTLPLSVGVADIDTFDLATVDQAEEVLVGDGVTVAINTTLSAPFVDTYNGQTIDIEVDGVSINVNASLPVADVEDLTTIPDVGSGSLNVATGALQFTFNSAPTTGQKINAVWDGDFSSETYFTLFNSNPEADDLALLVTYDTAESAWIINAERKDTISGEYSDLTDHPKAVSNVVGAKDGFGRNIFVETVYENSTDITAKVNSVLYSSFVDDTARVDMGGGDRGTAITATELVSAYAVMQDKFAYQINIFFATEAEASIATQFETMRSTYQTRSRYLLPGTNQSAADHLTGGATSKYNLDERGIHVYALNWGIHQDIYNNQNFLCSNMGLIAGKHADIVNIGNGGYAPMWIDENGMGGQLGSSIISLDYSASETQLRQLDSAQLNPVVVDPVYGPMIVSQRTTQTRLSDYSWIAHSGLADTIVKNIEDQVLPFQVGKLNDTTHQTQVKMQTETIMSNFTDLLNDYYVKCDDENNSDEIKAQRKFVLTVGVQFTPFSEIIEFIFINTAQGTDVEEVVNKG